MEDLDVWWHGAPVLKPEFKRVLMTYREGDKATLFDDAEVSLTYRPPEEPRLDIMPRDPRSTGSSPLSTHSRQNPEDEVYAVYFGDRDGDGLHRVPDKLRTFISSLAVGSIIKYNGTWINIIDKRYDYSAPATGAPSGFMDLMVVYRSFNRV
ncbi:hypothetical protein LOY46_01710 [Pseudomonas sichuanensis]|uniref:hypothetical protein n=1 Tax=Pseudomonas sichuanensis TaxID=2213015 RepID=UPI002160C59B|nr:hypothetical protein [Pseudomonas sichuanensis]UVK83459.1 hypothetical protein LOY46_01710 [Pseudomonas sichuanensis]